mmetsp:Transcript_8769/g.21201  ORF Transcript_8769/g.21201 Transcript_8769/m.21201 type:complete len:175 (+) Transcript_8769:1255-1779(+)
MHLSIFRGSGALVGVVGVTAFQAIARTLGITKTAEVFIVFKAFCSLAAAGTFALASSTQPAALYLFMLFVVSARFGLYGFEVGALQVQQTNVAATARGAFGTVEKSLCSAASLIMYGASAAVAGQGGSLFAIIVCGSALSICAASLTYRQWLSRLLPAGFYGMSSSLVRKSLPC